MWNPLTHGILSLLLHTDCSLTQNFLSHINYFTQNPLSHMEFFHRILFHRDSQQRILSHGEYSLTQNSLTYKIFSHTQNPLLHRSLSHINYHTHRILSHTWNSLTQKSLTEFFLTQTLTQNSLFQSLMMSTHVVNKTQDGQP